MKETSKLGMLQAIFRRAKAPLKYLGTKAMLPMDNGNVAEIILGSSGTMSSGKYDGVSVTITNKSAGAIAANFFSFEQYLGGGADRTHENAHMVKKVHVWKDRGAFDWYIVRPTTLKPVVDAVLDYIQVYE